MKKYKTTCAIILNAKKEFLLIKRAREPFKGAWALVSGIGGTKKGLSPEEAVRDEVYYDLQTLFEGRFIFSLPVESDQNTDGVVVFKGTVDEADIDPNPETVDVFGWFAKKDIRKLGPLAFEHEKILDKI
ncbi:MAG: hypothetical protein A3C84_04230 [Candidatus Ryanbacteria bacterium RIFCSPHIGHO2_02_FULL_48_12]|uniref:Nudix hydrolase domain-containing protein n=1 Tax=Candidatus Ryanbacteria bacterium RIFCSPHIGHO2_01_FULL_48_27 TaxID=1802115 RepID=A0A1G2G6N1_9BACT|nr:MAG: hypothetical protein A2756_00725 [Candidatus Ryanbacteria bacterium RIFCSPHIGHO2_01_FULL_48_27]OGZ48571.1 MAG: hypothetical protein A3C84_04230 [Candidatus Ryanbacteria bacterium RIFCSPHIGHO2_02_FULL_48_12]